MSDNKDSHAAPLSMRQPQLPRQNWMRVRASPEDRAKFNSRLRFTARLFAGLSVAVGVAVIYGWLFDIESLKRILPGLESMKFNTALLFVLSGAALHLLTREGITRTTGAGLGALVFVIAALTICQDLFELNFGIDELLYPDRAGTRTDGAAGRMSPATAAGFVFIGMATIGFGFTRTIALGQMLALASLSISLVAVAGYLFDASALYEMTSFSSMALHTAIGLTLLSIGLACARPGHGIAIPLAMKSASTLVLRRMVPLAVILPILLGGVLVAAQQFTTLNSVFAMAVASTASAIFLLALIWWTAQSISQKDAETHEERNYFETTLNSIGDAVIVTDTDLRIRFMNPVAETLTSWPFDKAVGRPIDEVFMIVDEATRDPKTSPLGKAIGQGEVVGLANHTILIDKHGREHFIDDSAAPVRDVSGRIRGAVLVFHEVNARRKAELSLRESEERFREMANGLPHIAWVHDASGALEFVNSTFCDFFGTAVEAATGEGWRLLVHPEDEEYLEEFARSIAGKCAFHAEVRARNAAGEWRLLESFGRPRFNASGEYTGIVGTSLDITERRAAEQQSRETTLRLEYAMEAGKLGEWSLDLRTGVALRSLRHDQIFGHSLLLPEWTFEKFMTYVYPDDRPHVQEAFERAITRNSDWNIETRILRADGKLRWIWARGSVVETDDGEPSRLSGIVQDITPRKRLEEANRFLAEIATPLNTLVDYESTLQKVAKLAVPFLADWCVIDLADQRGQLTRVANSHVTTGRSGLVHKLRLNYDDASTSILGEILKSRKSRHINQLSDEDLPYLANDPEQLSVLRELKPTAFIGVPLSLRDRCLGVIAFFSSESARQFSKSDVELAERVAERITVALENAKLYETVREADERKDVFLAMLAHELRNPLGALSNGLEILQLQATDVKSRWTLDMLNRQKRQLTRLLDDLMDVSRISRGKVALEKRPVELGPVLVNAIESVRPTIKEKSQRFGTKLETEKMFIDGDPARLEQIVTNLLANAVKYTPKGGTVTLATARDGDSVVIEVTDTGVGIPPHQLHTVFDLFTQIDVEDASNTTGLGLGLSLVREFVDMHGGTVEAASDGEGEGSIFTVRLPLHAGVADNPPPREDERLTHHSLDILIVDDNRDSSQALSFLLQKKGHRVRLEHDGLSGLKALREQRPDLMLLDIGLPDISGFVVAERIRKDEANRSICLVALTGYGQPRDYERTSSIGFDAHLVKPLDFEALNAIVAKRQRSAGEPQNASS